MNKVKEFWLPRQNLQAGANAPVAPFYLMLELEPILFLPLLLSPSQA